MPATFVIPHPAEWLEPLESGFVELSVHREGDLTVANLEHADLGERGLWGLFRQAASVPPTASPRSRMSFMITFSFASTR